jgi:hypothetical protein
MLSLGIFSSVLFQFGLDIKNPAQRVLAGAPVLQPGSVKPFGYPSSPDNRVQYFLGSLILNGACRDRALQNVSGLASRSDIAVGKAGEEDRAKRLLECLFVNHRVLSPYPSLQVAARYHHRIISKRAQFL